MGRFNVGEIGTARIIHSKSNVGDVVDVANDDLDVTMSFFDSDNGTPRRVRMYVSVDTLTKIRCVRHPLGMIGGLGDWGIPQWMELPYLSPL